MDTLRDQVLKHCFERFDGVLPNGEVANNRLNIEAAAVVPELRVRIAQTMGRLVMSRNPGFVVSASEGAHWLAHDVSLLYGMDHVRLVHDEITSETVVASERDRDKVYRHASGVLVADYFNSFSTVRAALKTFELHRRLSAAYAVWDRGFTRSRVDIPIPHRALVSYTIPPMLPDNSWFWSYADTKGS